MKKSFLIITVLIYFFSIIAELGIFDSFHSEAQAREKTNTSITSLLLKTQNQDIKGVGDLGDVGDCTESTCHTGHCHHISIFNTNQQNDSTNQIAKHSNSFKDNYFFQFARGIKRPPRNS